MAKQHIVVADIDALIRAGMPVLDANGLTIGSVKDYSSTAAYLVVRTGLVARVVKTGVAAPRDLYVPYGAIATIDPREVFLNVAVDVLMREYSAPPPPESVIDGPAVTAVVPNGYDGSPTTVNRVDMVMVRQGLFRGMVIYDTNGDRVGTVDDVDEAAGYMVAKDHFPSKTRLFIPFTLINTVDRAPETADGPALPRQFVLTIDPEAETASHPASPPALFLAVPRDVLLKDYTKLPDGIVLHTDDTATPGVEQQGES